jgi:hypothetical protein
LGDFVKKAGQEKKRSRKVAIEKRLAELIKQPDQPSDFARFFMSSVQLRRIIS